MPKGNEPVKENMDHAFTMTRIFDAPPAVVFEAWTKPEHLIHWWGRNDFTMPVCEVDLRTGGGFRFCMRSPKGVDYWVKGVYQEILAPARIVFTWSTRSSSEPCTVEYGIPRTAKS